MRHPIPGIVPPDLEEATIMTVWPGIGASGAGRWVGRMCGLRAGVGPFTVGALMALLTIPVSLTLYLWRLMPWACRRYTVTNRRIVIAEGLRAVDKTWIHLDEFDAIDVEVLPGHEWLRAGDIVLRRKGNEVLRLPSVVRPHIFREACAKAQRSLLAIRDVLRAQSQPKPQEMQPA